MRVVKCQTKIGAAQRVVQFSLYISSNVFDFGYLLTSFNCIYDVAFPREIKGIRHILHKKQSIQFISTRRRLHCSLLVARTRDVIPQ